MRCWRWMRRARGRGRGPGQAGSARVFPDDEAKAVEAKILGRAGRLTPGGLRSAVARAVMEAAPGKARQRRETAAKFARVERWAEDSGNAALMGRELPPDEVLAADQRKDSRPRAPPGRGRRRSAFWHGPLPRCRSGHDVAAPAGFAGRVTLTTLLGLDQAARPGDPGIGPVDPDPGANTPDRYQAITRELGPDAGYRSQRLRPASPTRMASSGGRPGR